MNEQIPTKQWKAWIDSSLAGDPRARALTHHMVVFRQAPGEPPVKLYEETSTGNPRILLREDGLLVMQSNGPPQFYFPGDTQPRSILPPPPQKLEKVYTPYDSLEKMFLFGDTLFYQRTPYPGDLMIGFFQIDAAMKSFPRNISVLEVRNTIGGSETWAASLGSEPIRRHGHILWLNRGQSNIKGVWRDQRLWAADLETGKLIGENAMPENLRINPLKPLNRPPKKKRSP